MYNSIFNFLKMLPSYERFDTNLPKKRISFGIFSFLLVSLPLFGFIFCVVWSIIHNFESANATHCHVYNVLPSISAAIGNYQPQRFVWQLVIVIHTPGRLLVSYMYIGRYHKRVLKSRRAIATFACVLNMVEIWCLLGLSLWTSTDHYEIHKLCFTTFIATSEIYMLITYVINRSSRKTDAPSEIKSINCKRNLFLINFISFCLAVYFFMRHNRYCEPGVYSFFSLFEYIVVLTNMGYHMTAVWDFNDKYLSYDWAKGVYLTKS